ncbi:hypothetical protein LDENG_00181870 [Lucifuga dentata]|nr:hypothetical protein LDENG_00181870 [Lucifuga dentata]
MSRCTILNLLSPGQHNFEPFSYNLQSITLSYHVHSPTQSHRKDDYMSQRGLTEFDLQGPFIPCNLLLIGDHSFPLAVNSQGQVLMAASLYGRGRIVVLGHKG